MKKFSITGLAAAAVLAGCCTTGSVGKSGKVEVQAPKTAEKIVLDGKLDEAAWAKAPVYALKLPVVRAQNSSPEYMRKAEALPEKQGECRLLWDDRFLYVGISFPDMDVVAEGTREQEHHYLKGDLAELFLKPENAPWYWELYVTPKGIRTGFFYPGRGRAGLPSALPAEVPLKKFAVAAHVDGTLNFWRDADKGWTAEMAVPRDEISAAGVELAPDVPWRIFIGRYDYSAYLPYTVLASFPQQETANYHLFEEYGFLKLQE